MAPGLLAVRVGRVSGSGARVVARLFDGRDEGVGVGVALDGRSLRLAVGGRVLDAVDAGEGVGDALFAVFAGHPGDGERGRHAVRDRGFPI